MTRIYRLGVDIGGTFTDIVMLREDGVAFSRKVLSTPDDYSRAIEEGCVALLAQLGAAPGQVTEFVHATTVATNTIIERKGARVGLVTTRGFRDVLEIGRFRTPRLYDLHWRRPDPLVERQLRLDVRERIAADGSIVVPLDLAEAEPVAAAFRAAGVEAVAVTLINSHVNPAHERGLADRLAQLLPGVAVTASVDLLPQLGEYERSSTTVVNAYIRPVVGRYVEALQRRMDAMRLRAPLMIMQSSGAVAPGGVVARQPIDIIESGPAAGVLGAERLGRLIGLRDMIVFDMGGTTAKATIIEGGAFALCPETEVGGGAALGTRMLKGAGYPVQVPTIDIAEVGAGGGSIAGVDAAGGLQVGPRSAGAAPGPVCYGRGGTQPTVTDANLLLGYLNPEALVSGELALDRAAAEAAVSAMAARLGLGVTEVAHGIHLIANATMLRALRSVSSEKGRDPAQFALFAIGGNGPVHAASLAEAAGMTRIVVPPVAGLFSALGMLFADVGHQLVAAFYRRLADVTPEALDAAFAPLRDRGAALLRDEGFVDPEAQDFAAEVAVKYAGQTAPLPVPVALPMTAEGLQAMAASFHRLHEATFGYAAPEEPLQLVSVKLSCAGRGAAPRMPDRLRRGAVSSRAGGSRRAWFGTAGWRETPVIARADLAATPRPGPLIVEEYDTTIVVPPGWRASLDAWENVVMERGAA
jgi:N-methylhydantoinase A